MSTPKRRALATLERKAAKATKSRVTYEADMIARDDAALEAARVGATYPEIALAMGLGADRIAQVLRAARKRLGT